MDAMDLYRQLETTSPAGYTAFEMAAWLCRRLESAINAQRGSREVVPLGYRRFDIGVSYISV